MITNTRSMTTAFYGMTVADLQKFLDGVPAESKITVSVYLAGNDPRESDQLTLSVKVGE